MAISSICFLGCGNMAQAIAKGIYSKRKDLNIHTYTPTFTKALQLAKDVEGQAHKKLAEIPECDLYILGCKPQQIEDLANMAKEFIPKNAIILSLLAGTTVSRLKDLFENQKIVRTMPNTPILVGAGYTAFYFADAIEKDVRKEMLDIFSNASVVHEFSNEEEIDLITPFSGSGPAFIFQMATLLSEKAINLGLEKEVAFEAVIETIYGSALMMKSSQDTPETLRNNVTSKKGVTFEALEVFKNYWPESIDKGIEAAIKRGKELSQQKE